MEEIRQVSDILADFERTLSDEAVALRALDADALDDAALRKLELDDELRKAARVHPVTAEDRIGLERLRRLALNNQLLLVHARSCVMGVLSLATGQNFDSSYAGARRPRSTPAPFRLDVRG